MSKWQVVFRSGQNVRKTNYLSEARAKVLLLNSHALCMECVSGPQKGERLYPERKIQKEKSFPITHVLGGVFALFIFLYIAIFAWVVLTPDPSYQPELTPPSNQEVFKNE